MVTFPILTPEQAGVPSAAVSRFFARLEDAGLIMHSTLLLRDGCIFAEGYWKPYDVEMKHRMYSVSKTFAAMAIGILAGDGKLSLDDRVAGFFPEYEHLAAPQTARTTIRDLLRMTTPFSICDYARSDDWTKAFFTTPATHDPGSSFRYDTLATVMLCMIVRRVSGVEFIDLLHERVFGPAGMTSDIWCVRSPCGHDWGGSGVIATPRDLARFAQIIMDGGRFAGQQLIPENYVREATSALVNTRITTMDLEHQQGYGYQIWRTRHNGFAMRGMGGQLALCLPDYGLMLITTADNQSIMSGDTKIYSALWGEILPHLEKVPAVSTVPAASAEPRRRALAPDDQAAAALRRQLDGLSLRVVKGAAGSPTADRIRGKTYRFGSNELHWRWARFDFGTDSGTLSYENDTGRHELRFGFGRQERQEFPETHYADRQVRVPAGKGYDCCVSAAWVMPDSLVLYCFSLGSFVGTMRLNAVFQGDRLTIQAEKYAEFFFDEYSGFASGELEQKA